MGQDDEREPTGEPERPECGVGGRAVPAWTEPETSMHRIENKPPRTPADGTREQRDDQDDRDSGQTAATPTVSGREQDQDDVDDAEQRGHVEDV